MEPTNSKNPWKGLQAYQENDLIYGRDAEIKELYTDIIYNTQTVVYGKSGIGKSSIVNAGIIPRARLDGILPVSIRFCHSVGQDTGDSVGYADQIRQRIYEEASRVGAVIEELVPHSGSHPESLWELLHRHCIWTGQDENRTRLIPMLLIDQFEEIFTLENDEEKVKSFFRELADLLNEIQPEYLSSDHEDFPSGENGSSEQGNGVDRKNIFSRIVGKTRTDNPEYLSRSDFHIVFILREDFLSYLERYTACIPVMKNNRYAMLPLNEEQVMDIIMQPQPGLVSSSVAELIIQKVTGRTDFSIDSIPEINVDAAVLSLYLSRIYEKKHGDEITADVVMQFSDDIIRDFYDESMAGIPEEIVEKLEDELLTSDNRRNNVSRTDLIMGGVPSDVIDTLLNDKYILRQFSYSGDLRIEFMHDILCKVVSNRIFQREQDRILMEGRIREQALRLRNKRLKFSIVGSVLVLIAATVILWDGLYNDISINYGQVIKRNGWYEGIERLSSEESSFRDCSYILKRKGRWSKHPYAMQARDGYGNLTTDHAISTYLLDNCDRTDSGAMADMVRDLNTVCQWEFVADQEGDFVIQERAMDKDGNVIYAYNRSITSDKNKIIGSYSDVYGFPLMFRDSAYLFLGITMDKRGFEVLYEFYDDMGMPVTNKDGVYKTRKYYLDNGIQSMELSCGLDGRPVIDRFDNCGWIVTEFTPDSLLYLETVYIDDDDNPQSSTDESITVTRFTYDEHCRRTSTSWWTYDGYPDTGNSGYHAQIYEYDDHGKCTSICLKDKDGNDCFDKDGYGASYFVYDKDGEIVEERHVYRDMTNVFSKVYDDGKMSQSSYTLRANDTICQYRSVFDYDKNESIEFYPEYCVRKVYDNYFNLISLSYYDEDDDNPIEVSGFHEKRIDYDFREGKKHIRISFFGVDGNLVVPDKQKWAVSESVIDLVDFTVAVLEYDSGLELLAGYKKLYEDDSFKHPIAVESINDDLQTIRNYSGNSFYYRLNLISPAKPSRRNEIIGFYAVNEFNEPSLIFKKSSRGSDSLFHTCYFSKSGTLYFDEFGIPMNPEDQVRTYLSYVERIDGTPETGFVDGDIIIECNDWVMNTNDPVNNANKIDFPWDVDGERHFVVARVNSDRSSYDTVHVNIPSGMSLDRYVRFKKFRASSYEYERLEKVIDTYLWKTVIRCHVADTECQAYKSGIEGYIYLLEYNGWTLNGNGVDTLQTLEQYSQPEGNHFVYWNPDTETVCVFDTDSRNPGFVVDKLVSFNPYYYQFMIDSYKTFKDNQSAQ
ncbi:MAG: ATP-binding protein [Candidatus Cryptobacteroides sp.]